MAQWEWLVTEGHVRAARWRNIALPMAVIGIAAILVGAFFSTLLPSAALSTQVAESKAVHVNAQRAAIIAFMRQLEAPLETPENAEALPSFADGSTRFAGVLAALNESGRLPRDIEAVNREAFWEGGWQAGTAYSVRRDRTILIGQLVNLARPDPNADTETTPVLARQVTLLRRGDDREWRAYCLALPHGAPCTRAEIYAEDIPRTMYSFLPRAARRAGGAT
ncbi:MAG: hypothetical protein JJU26_13295 [Oceanicaulis sp.]|uniref:hypothetical protein n=1 Tax=Glycocaulis sp. TaxID=1969725 RepID=UPI0025B8527A|nr:hypothetical protein [Glycocaulis sp.]MCC5982682.1 hypothetical protein [Oceanicaulis sp.]MCH8522837.1 hypothetical protein [Glycocaulis sp.]